MSENKTTREREKKENHPHEIGFACCLNTNLLACQRAKSVDSTEHVLLLLVLCVTISFLAAVLMCLFNLLLCFFSFYLLEKAKMNKLQQFARIALAETKFNKWNKMNKKKKHHNNNDDDIKNAI